MSEKTYTAAEVAVMIAAAKAEKSDKAVKFSANSGVFKDRKGVERPFANIKVEGNFYPTSLSYSAAEAILANLETFKAVVASKPKVEAPKPVLTSGGEPRLAKS